MKHHKGDRRQTMRIVILAVCVSVFAMVVIGRGVSSLTETGGGIPAPPCLPDPAIKNFNPKVTATFTDQESFLDSVTCRSVSRESFEDLAAANRINISGLSLRGFTITTENQPQLGIWNELYQGAFATDGHQWLGIEENLLVVPHVTTLTFDVFINHFGINITDYGDFGSGNLVFANDIDDQATAAFSGQPSGNRQFFGIINSARAFRTVTLTHSVGGEFYGIDEITYCWQGSPDELSNRQPSGRVSPD